MAKKQKSFADKAAGTKENDAVYVKYVKSIKSEKTGQWRFNEQMVRSKKGEQLDVALNRMDEAANLVDIDLSEFEIGEAPVEEVVAEAPEVEESPIEAETEEASEKPVEVESREAPVEELVAEAPEVEESFNNEKAEEPVKEDTKE